MCWLKRIKLLLKWIIKALKDNNNEPEEEGESAAHGHGGFPGKVREREKQIDGDEESTRR